MTISRFILTITACVLLGAGCSYPQNHVTRSTQPVTSVWLQDSATTTPSFIDADVFALPELQASAELPLPEELAFACQKYRAGIVNHHALASDLLAVFFRTLERCRPEIKTIIILSPDHFGQASAAVTTHRLPYRVSGSTISINETLVDHLSTEVRSNSENSSLFTREHGIGALLPFLAASSPEVRIVPVVIRSQMDDVSRAEIATWLKNQLKNRAIFVVVSSDMSHYLTAEIAWEKQAETDRALSDSDADFFVAAKDDYTDNGESIAVVMNALGKTKWHPIKEAISSDYAGSSGFTTTYVIGFWD